MSIETRNSSALFKRAEQLKRWEESDTNSVPMDIKDKPRKIKFSEGCVFLAACAAGDKGEVRRLLEKGTDIDTTNVDGLSALHQACIDDNLDMVEFLVTHGADVNKGDNEGWTPLHATASCGFLSIAKYLIDNGADVAAVNNDGELPIDIAESDEMEELFQEQINLHGIDCEAARTEEEQMMVKDAKQWLNSRVIGDVPHPKTGATALHVAAAKGYIKVLSLLLQAGVDINAQDYDGWTSLHAASHWAQREACEILAENLCNMDIKNYVGQTAFDVADADVMGALEELKKKQASMQKDKPEIESILRRSAPPLKRRSSVTRMSVSDKNSLISKDASSERLVLDKSIAEEAKKEKKISSSSETETDSEKESAEVERRNRANRENNAPVIVCKNTAKDLPKRVPSFAPKTVQDGEEDFQSWRRPGSFRSRNDNESSKSYAADEGNTSPVTSKPNPAETSQPLRNAHSPTNEESGPLSQEDAEPAISATIIQSPSPNVRRSFVPPVRDEESETQRKAHAKRVRETRRSTQGVTLEDLKSAEQYVKKQTSPTTPSSGADDNPGKKADKDKSETGEGLERRPSWRLRLDDNDKSKFSLEDVRARAGGDADTTVTLPLKKRTSEEKDEDKENDTRTAVATQAAIQRRRKPKRRSTGVVHIDMDDIDPDKKDNSDRDDLSPSSGASSRLGSSSDSAQTSRSNSVVSENGELDYKKLYEDARLQNERLRQDLKETKGELLSTKEELDKVLQKNSSRYAVTENEKREKRALERKLSEMEEELKVLEQLKLDNQRLRDENGALIRVISKLSK